MTSRRAFLTSLAVAAVAPGALTGALTATPVVSSLLRYSNPATIPLEQALDEWARQYAHRDNPVWSFHGLCKERYGEAVLDRGSFEHLAALCDEPVTSTPLS